MAAIPDTPQVIWSNHVFVSHLWRLLETEAVSSWPCPHHTYLNPEDGDSMLLQMLASIHSTAWCPVHCFLAVMYGKLPKCGLISQIWCVSAWENSDVISLLVFSYRFSSSRSGRIYLHSDIRMIIFRKSDMDTATAHGMDMAYELRSFTHGPTNPKFSPYKWPFDHMTVLFTGMPVTELVILLVTTSLCCLFVYWTSKSVSSPVRSDHWLHCLSIHWHTSEWTSYSTSPPL